MKLPFPLTLSSKKELKNNFRWSFNDSKINGRKWGSALTQCLDGKLSKRRFLQKREKLYFFRGNKSFDYLLIQFEGELKHLLKRLQFIKKEVCLFFQTRSMYERMRYGVFTSFSIFEAMNILEQKHYRCGVFYNFCLEKWRIYLIYRLRGDSLFVND